MFVCPLKMVKQFNVELPNLICIDIKRKGFKIKKRLFTMKMISSNEQFSAENQVSSDRFLITKPQKKKRKANYLSY